MLSTQGHRSVGLRGVAFGAIAALVPVAALAGCSSEPDASDTIASTQQEVDGAVNDAASSDSDRPQQQADGNSSAGGADSAPSDGGLTLPKGLPESVPVVDGKLLVSGGGPTHWGVTVEVDDAAAAAAWVRAAFIDADFEVREWTNEYGAVDGHFRSSYGYLTTGDIGVVVDVEGNDNLNLRSDSDVTYDPDGWHVTYEGASPDAWAKTWNPDHGGDDGAAAANAPDGS